MIYDSSLDAWPIFKSAKLIVILKVQPAVPWLITVLRNTSEMSKHVVRLYPR